MHSTETINQFLNFCAQGSSFARIADHLHVSKPTLLDWSHKLQSELEAMKANQQNLLVRFDGASRHALFNRVRVAWQAIAQEFRAVFRNQHVIFNADTELLIG